MFTYQIRTNARMGLTNATLLPPYVLIQSVLMNVNVYLVSNGKILMNVKVTNSNIFRFNFHESEYINVKQT